MTDDEMAAEADRGKSDPMPLGTYARNFPGTQSPCPRHRKPPQKQSGNWRHRRSIPNDVDQLARRYDRKTLEEALRRAPDHGKISLPGTTAMPYRHHPLKGATPETLARAHIAFVVTLAGTAVAVLEEVMGLQPAERPRSLPRAI